MECGGWIFNRHAWYKPVPHLRVCVKCGETQWRLLGDFVKTSFETFISRLEQYRQELSGAEASKKRALKWLEGELNWTKGAK